jgi:ubiquinone biosynthesis O-methyltransferase
MTGTAIKPHDGTAASSKSIAGLPESYAKWRTSRLGNITDALETQLLCELLGPLAGLQLLDVGCGDGALASELSRRGADVTGLDADPAMVTAAGMRAEARSAQLHFVEGNAERLPFGDAAFDCVVAVTVLCFVRDAERAVAEMARVLKPGGQLVIGELGRWSLWAAYRRVRGWLGAETWRAARFRTAAELASLVSSAGLKLSETRGGVFYPPFTAAARILAPIDAWLGRRATFGAAFIALWAIKSIAEPIVIRGKLDVGVDVPRLGIDHRARAQAPAAEQVRGTAGVVVVVGPENHLATPVTVRPCPVLPDPLRQPAAGA